MPWPCSSPSWRRLSPSPGRGSRSAPRSRSGWVLGRLTGDLFSLDQFLGTLRIVAASCCARQAAAADTSFRHLNSREKELLGRCSISEVVLQSVPSNTATMSFSDHAVFRPLLRPPPGGCRLVQRGGPLVQRGGCRSCRQLPLGPVSPR
jgi:hypothetical protein